MDVDHAAHVLRTFINELEKLFEAFRGTSLDHEPVVYRRVAKLLHLLAPLLTVVIFYQYLKYLLVLNAYEYEESVKKRSGYVRKLSRQLRLLTKRKASLRAKAFRVVSTTGVIPENGYFPATRVMRTNLLMDLIHGDHSEARNMSSRGSFGFGDWDLIDLTDDEGGPLSEINLNIMKCSRELIIQGVKDFDVMSTVFRVMETVMGEEED